MDTNQLAAQSALRKMFDQGHFSICTIDTILKALNRIAEPAAHNTLSMLHCVSYRDMPPELREKLPDLIKRALGDVGFNIEFAKPEPEPVKRETVIETHVTISQPQPRPRSILTRLLGR